MCKSYDRKTSKLWNIINIKPCMHFCVNLFTTRPTEKFPLTLLNTELEVIKIKIKIKITELEQFDESWSSELSLDIEA